jgi:Protein of unknown function (DUF4232)
MMTRRTVARGFLLTTGVVAAIALAGCGGGTTAAGTNAGSPVTSGSDDGGSGATFVPVTTTTTTAPANAGAGNGGGEGGGGGTAQLAGGTPECKPANLKLSLGPGDGAAGHVYQALRFTNSSSQNCVIVGFPGVSYVTGSNGAQVGPPADRDGAIGSEIVLKPGQVASALLTLTDVGVFDPTACKPTPTLGLRVYPPDSTASMFVAQNGTGCAGTPPSSQLRVQTIKAGLGDA